MKFLVVLVAVLGVSWAAPSTFTLQEDLQQIVALIPVDEIREIARQYAPEDEEFQAVVDYLLGDERTGLVEAQFAISSRVLNREGRGNAL
ncbi:hypothetical protein Trydic_g13281 [Trypoxylus dichotomus]